jgi:hypothetical protein
MKIVLKYALVVASLLLAWDVILYNYLFVSFGAYSVLVQALIIGGGVFLGLRELKFRQYNGEISYKNATVNGFFLTITAALIYAVGLFNLYPYGNSDFQNQVKQITLEHLAIQKAPQKQIDETMKSFEKLLEPKAMAKAAAINTIIIGVVLTLILSSILRKKDNPDKHI